MRALIVLVLLLANVVHAAEDGKPGQSAEQFEASLHYADGEIALPGGIARLVLSSDFRYLPPEDAERVLVEAWGNPAGNETLGMLLPTGQGATDPQSFGVIITYEEDGHVEDDDADSIDYDELLQTMQEQGREQNEQRKKQGYQPVDLLGWAERPYYDQDAHKLHWAKRLRFGEAEGETLNYNIRILGREGVLVLNAVAGMDQLDAIKPQLQRVVGFTEFTDGNRYADFDASTDKTAAYGLAALVAGGVAAKAGLFAKLFALLIAFKKLLIVAFLAAAGAIGNWFKGRRV